MTETKRPETYDDLYPGRFLKAVQFKGKKVVLTIDDVYREELEGKKGPETKAIVKFKEVPLALVACKTNGICLKAMFGNDLANWIGKKVILFPDTWNGEPCIRVWGSPELKEELSVEVKLARRNPMTKTMHTSKEG